MTRESRIALFLLLDLFAALRANDSDAFRCWLSGGVQDLREPVVEELVLYWPDSFLTLKEQDRLLGWGMGVSL